VTHNMLKALLAVFMVAVAIPNVSTAQAAPKQSLKTALHLEDYTTLKYQDEDGTPIPESTFMKIMSTGRSFSIYKDREISVATLSINPMKTDDQKQSSADQSNAGLKVQVGKKIPKALRDKLVGSSGDIATSAGRPILVSFFFHDCIPCIQEVPALNYFAKNNRNFAVLAVTFEAEKEANSFASKYDFKWPIAANSEDLIALLGVKTYPTLILLSANGTLLGARVGDLRSASKGGNSIKILENWVQASMRPKHN